MITRNFANRERVLKNSNPVPSLEKNTLKEGQTTIPNGSRG